MGDQKKMSGDADKKNQNLDNLNESQDQETQVKGGQASRNQDYQDQDIGKDQADSQNQNEDMGETKDSKSTCENWDQDVE